MSRKGAHSCPIASGVIFAVNVDVRGVWSTAGAPLRAYSQKLLVSMQARHLHFCAASSCRHSGLDWYVCRGPGMRAVSDMQGFGCMGESDSMTSLLLIVYVTSQGQLLLLSLFRSDLSGLHFCLSEAESSGA